MNNQIHINNTDLTLSAIGFGTGNAGITWKDDYANELLEHFLELGGNFIDTAHVYSDWIPGEIARSERILGDWLTHRGKRDDVILSTKGGHPKLDTMNISRMSLSEMRTDLEGSLEKLRTDYIDIYFYHRDDVNRPVEELIENMELFQKEGKIRYYACSNWTTPRMKEADTYCKKMGYRGFVANQARYNIGTKHKQPLHDPTTTVCDHEMLEYHRNTDNLLMPYSGICSGFFHQLQNNNGILDKDPHGYGTPNNLQIAKNLEAICEKRDYHLSQALLGFFRVHDIPIVPLFSTSRIENMELVAKYMSTEYHQEDYEQMFL